MNKIKIVLTALLMGLFIQPAMAETSTNANLAYAFDTTSGSLQIDLLTAQDMETTEGKFLPYVGRIGLGFGAGFAGSTYNQYNSSGNGWRDVNWRKSFTTGAIVGGFGGASRWLSNRGWY